MPLDGVADYRTVVRQPDPLAPDARGVLDNMLDEWILDEGSYVALNLFVPRDPILRLIQQRQDAIEAGADLAGPLPASQYRARAEIAPAMIALADATIHQLPRATFDALACTSLKWLLRDIQSWARFYADWVFEDETVGGCMQAWRRGRDRRIHRNGEVYKRTLRRIQSPAYIKRYIARAEDSPRRRAIAGRILDRVEKARSFAASFEDFSWALAEQRERARLEAIRQWTFNLRTLELAEPGVKPNKVLRADQKRVRRQRQVIKRAARIASALVPAEQVRAFVRGAPARLPGRTLDLLVSCERGAAEIGHGAVAVAVHAPGGGQLAELCTYIESTPALDQLAAFALAMQAGEEADIIGDANIIALTEAGREHPLLAERQRRHAESVSSTRAADRASQADNWTTIGRDHWSREEMETRKDAYWDATAAIWLERLAVYVCGRRVKLLAKASAACGLTLQA